MRDARLFKFSLSLVTPYPPKLSNIEQRPHRESCILVFFNGWRQPLARKSRLRLAEIQRKKGSSGSCFGSRKFKTGIGATDFYLLLGILVDASRVFTTGSVRHRVLGLNARARSPLESRERSECREGARHLEFFCPLSCFRQRASHLRLARLIHQPPLRVFNPAHR
jgi:hypothetical protein